MLLGPRRPAPRGLSRRRSSSADATRFLDDDDGSSQEARQAQADEQEATAAAAAAAAAEDADAPRGNSNSLQKEAAPSPSSVHIRRSSSVPCKGGNRDSSSSNDSGVSTASLRTRGADFAEFELPLTTASSARRRAVGARVPLPLCLHASLPRRSRSVDPLRELSFSFQKVRVPAKSSSAEAQVPVCAPKGFQSPGGEPVAAPYTDSRSTSSGTSDMSDYIETLSLSSHSSSDAPDALRLGRPAATTLRPRSGKEYHLIDRSNLDGDLKGQSCGGASVSLEKGLSRALGPPYVPFTPLPEKVESPSPGYVSASPGQERDPLLVCNK